MGSRKSKDRRARSVRGSAAPLTKTGETTSPQRVDPSGSKALTLSVERFSGPLPHPDDFAAYVKALPSAGDRILGMAEQQSTHRQSQETLQLNLVAAVQRRRQWFGFIVFVLCLAAGVYLLSQGMALVGTGVLIPALAELFVTVVVKFRDSWNRGGSRGSAPASGSRNAGQAGPETSR